MDERVAEIIEALTSDDEELRAAQLAELNDEALESLLDDLRAASDPYREKGDDLTDEDVAEVARIRDAFQMVKAEQAMREETAAAEAEAAATRAAETQALLDEMAPAPEAEAEETVEAADEETEAPEPEPVQAATPKRTTRRPSLAELATRPPQPEPEPTRIEYAHPRWEVVLQGNKAGRFLENRQDIADRVNEARHSLLEAPAGFAEKVVVARLEADYPAERTFDADDSPVDNMRKIDAITAAARDRDSYSPEVEAIVASGGFAAPAEPRYDIFNISDQSRPVAAAMARVGVTRGQITVVPAWRLSNIVTGGPGTSGAAISLWTNTTDTTPGGSTKQRQSFGARAPQTCSVQAIVARGRFGNFMGRAFPELVADDVTLMMTAHARIAEVALLDCIIDAMNFDVSQTGFFGTARDLKTTLMQAAANIRSRERSSAAIRAIVPREALGMVVVDFLNQQGSGEIDAPSLTEDGARSFLGTTGLNLAYSLDTSTGADAFQIATDGANLPDWPDDFEIPIFPEGSALFLDGGRLDLGIVRDSTLNNTNDYEMFVETFEGCCWLGPYGMTLSLTTCPSGESQTGKAVTTFCSGS